jgi:uncharacterized protein YheU (UPF0270 family)
MISDREIEIQYDEEPVEQPDPHREEGVEVPFDRINPETLTILIGEFVTREWEELGDTSFTLEQKIEQVRQQLKEGKAKIVFDMTTNTCNIMPSK